MATAEQRYRSGENDRNWVLDKGRNSARLTVPYLIPESNDPVTNNKDTYSVPWNGIGARGVLNLASRMLLALLPPTQQFFRFSLDEAALAQQGVGPEQKSQYEEALSKIERMVLREIEASNDRVVLHEALLHLIVAGNALLYVSSDGLRVFHLNRYVCFRDPMGNPLEAVTCEQLPYYALPEKVRQMLEEEEEEDLKGLYNQPEPLEAKEEEKNCKVYTHIKWEGNQVKWHQEVKNKIVPGSEGKAPKSLSPWLPLRMTRVDGQAYGVGYVESAAIADLQTVEALCQAIAEGALASAAVRFLVKPSGVTKAADLAKAPNGSFVTGDPNDVLALQVQKSQDLSVAMQGKEQIERRLAQAFMLNDQRNAERVTAEEVRMTQLITEQSIGSIYSILQTEFQVPYVARKLDILTRENKVPRLPDDLVKPIMTVGLAAVGRGHELEQLVRFTQTLAQTVGPEGLAQYLKPTELITRLAYSMGIDTLGLIKTEQELQAEAQQAQEQAQQQALLQSAMGDPQKLANAAQTANEMINPPQEAQ
tara:strand:- start:1305 stop:2909 length:1605 start_codon:yes stop_codon:yes gene_type:complete